jgi:hypothetical protein
MLRCVVCLIKTGMTAGCSTFDLKTPLSFVFACRDALQYIALREDYKTARVDGKPLVVLFSGEGLDSHMAAAGGRR